jgi:hypothetical protein
MIRSASRALFLALGFRRPPLPPIYRRADWRTLAKMNALLCQDRRQFPTRYH